MKLIAYILATAVAVTVVLAVISQVDCGHWNTRYFFEEASTNDVQRCLSHPSVDLDVATTDGETPLHFAAAYGTDDVVRFLLRAGALPNTQTVDGWAPLHNVAVAGDAETVKALLDAGADPRIRGYADRTPLHVAAANGNAEAVAMLLKAGVDVDVKTTEGYTPLFEAAQRIGLNSLYSDDETTEVVTILLAAGADPVAADNSGLVPFDTWVSEDEEFKETEAFAYWQSNISRRR